MNDYDKDVPEFLRGGPPPVDHKRIEELQRNVYELGPMWLWLARRSLKENKKRIKRTRRNLRRDRAELKRLVEEARAQGYIIEDPPGSDSRKGGAVIENWPTKKYATVVIDPPWDYGAFPQKERRGYAARLPYTSMPLDEIKALPVGEIVADHAWIFVWTTHRFLVSALGCIENWGGALPMSFDLAKAVWSNAIQSTGVQQRVCHHGF